MNANNGILTDAAYDSVNDRYGSGKVLVGTVSIQVAAGSKPFLVNVTDTAREFLLMEGTDFRYGARHLKRAIERLLVQPLSNLMASGQIRRGDCIRVSHEYGSAGLLFGREPEAVQAWGVAGRAA